MYGHRLCLKFLLTRNPYLFANNNEDKSAIDVAISSDILNEFQEFITKSKDTNTKKIKKEPPASLPTGGTGAEFSKPITGKVNDSTGGGSASGKSSGVNSSNESRNR
jgi:hypothetical protein